MSRTGLDAADLAQSLRSMAGDGGIEWVTEPMQASGLLDIADALDENAKLRDELAKARDPQRIGGSADPDSFAYAIEQLREFRWQHATNDEDAIPYINNVAAAHERENAKLRELVTDMWFWHYEGHIDSESQESQMKHIDGVLDRMHELGIEVDA